MTMQMIHQIHPYPAWRPADKTGIDCHDISGEWEVQDSENEHADTVHKHWIGLGENLQENPIFHGKNHSFL